MSRSSSCNSLSSDDEYYGDNGEQFRGSIIQNRYALIEKIGYGSYSSVWLVFNIQNNTYYAMKIQNSEDYEEGVEEMKILKKLKEFNNKNIINLVESFEIVKKEVEKVKIKKGKKSYMKKKVYVNKHVCMVMPLMAGSIYSLIREGKYSSGLPLHIVKKCLKSLLESVLLVHSKIKYCHTDLKPENMLITGTSLKVREIIDEYNSFKLVEKAEEKIKQFMDNKKWNLSNPNIKKKVRKIKTNIYRKIHNEILENMVCLENIESDEESEYSSSDESDSDKKENVQIKLGEEDRIESDSSDINSIEKEYNEDDLSDTDSDPVNNYEVIDDHTLETGDIILTDFGSAMKISELDDELQTRYYRAPEIILNTNITEKIDIWSIGCIVFELFTGNILFDPDKDQKFSRDFHHLYLIEELFGKIPSYLIKNTPRRKEFFNKKNKLRCEDIKHIELEEEIARKNDDVIDFIKKCLVIDPKQRPDINTLLKHKLFQEHEINVI